MARARRERRRSNDERDDARRGAPLEKVAAAGGASATPCIRRRRAVLRAGRRAPLRSHRRRTRRISRGDPTRTANAIAIPNVRIPTHNAYSRHARTCSAEQPSEPNPTQAGQKECGYEHRRDAGSTEWMPDDPAPCGQHLADDDGGRDRHQRALATERPPTRPLGAPRGSCGSDHVSSLGTLCASIDGTSTTAGRNR